MLNFKTVFDIKLCLQCSIMLTVEVRLVIEVRISAVDPHNVAVGLSTVLIRLTEGETMWLRQ